MSHILHLKLNGSSHSKYANEAEPDPPERHELQQSPRWADDAEHVYIPGERSDTNRSHRRMKTLLGRVALPWYWTDQSRSIRMRLDELA